MEAQTPARPRGRFKYPFHIHGATATLWDRFWAKVDMSGGPTACWPFLGAKRKRRSGSRGNHQVGGRGSRTISADRLALALHTDGNLSKKKNNILLECCHRCGNGDAPIFCVNPHHEYWGTRSQNEKDKGRKKRREIAEAVRNTAAQDERDNLVQQRIRRRPLRIRSRQAVPRNPAQRAPMPHHRAARHGAHRRHGAMALVLVEVGALDVR